METKKSLIQLAILVVFVIMAAGSGSSSSSTSHSYSSSSSSGGYSNPAYSRQASAGKCAACGGLGYITNRSGERETCICGGSGKATEFPAAKSRY